MTGLDTNILVRYFIQDDPAQSRKATEIIEQRLTEDSPGFISIVTIVEMVWVLGSIYAMSHQEIARAVERVLQADSLVLQNEREVFAAAAMLKSGRGSFADALIGALGEWWGCTSTFTFDKKAARLSGFQLV